MRLTGTKAVNSQCCKAFFVFVEVLFSTENLLNVVGWVNLESVFSVLYGFFF